MLVAKPACAQLASARRAHEGAGGQPSFQGAAALWQNFHHRRAALSVASMLAS
jgi:hypothetical protein